MLSFINYPAWISPEIFPGFPVRWYGLMYLVAFLIVYILVKKQIKTQKLEITNDTLTNTFFWVILGLLIGARIFSALIYDQSGEYWAKPYLIFWPFDSKGNFTGLAGMSYHGGLIGCLTAFLIYCKVKKINFLQLGDALAVAVPAGYTFGRIGNFINGELWGRVTAVPWGMIFPDAPNFPIRETWVRELAAKAGIDLSQISAYVNLPRHPSQLYEALFEGIILFLVLWFFLRKQKLPAGSMIGAYIAGYGFVRFFIEYFREPDHDIGYIITFSRSPGHIYRLDSFLNFSMGQLLCFLMILGGTGFILFLKWREKNKAAENQANQNTKKPKHKKRR